jgi:hypothetical protein
VARRLAAGLALALVLGSCGHASRDKPAIGPATSTTTPTSTTLAGQAPATTSGSTATTRRTQAGGSTPSNTPGGPGGSGNAAAIDDAADSPPGFFAGVLLAAGPATSLVLDVRVGAGASPSRDAIDAMAQILQAQSGKPVTIGGPSSLRGVGGGTHSADEIRSLADSQGTPNRDGVAVVHVFYLAGQFEKDGVLGVSVRGDTLAIFTDTMDSATSPFVTRARLERAVATHELGHLLGLVDLYLDDNRDDAQHPGHSTNRASVMYWAVETSLVGQVLGGPPPVDFDSNDLADLRRIRAGAPRA